MTYVADPKSVAGRNLLIRERTDLLVIGAGPAGLACALTAAGQGRQVVLVDENPVDATTMGDDVPLLFGGRVGGAVRNRNAMLEALIASDPEIADAFEAGIDLRFGTACWGLYAPGPSVGWLPGPVAAMMDESRSWMIAANQVVVATGRRDMGLAFPGWELPGVIGAMAAVRLADRYGALEARRAVVLGTTAEALQAALSVAGGRSDGGSAAGPGGWFRRAIRDGCRTRLCRDRAAVPVRPATGRGPGRGRDGRRGRSRRRGAPPPGNGAPLRLRHGRVGDWCGAGHRAAGRRRLPGGL